LASFLPLLGAVFFLSGSSCRKTAVTKAPADHHDYLRGKIARMKLTGKERATALLYLEGRELARKGAEVKATDILEQVLSEDPQGALIERTCNKHLLKDLAILLDDAGQTEKAIVIWEKWWICSASPNALHSLAAAVDKRGPTRARQYYAAKAGEGKDEFLPYLARSTYNSYVADFERAAVKQRESGKLIEDRDDVAYDRRTAFRTIWKVVERDITLDDANCASYMKAAPGPLVFDMKKALFSFRCPEAQKLLKEKVNAESEGIALLSVSLLAGPSKLERSHLQKLDGLKRSKTRVIAKTADVILKSLQKPSSPRRE